MIKIKEEIVERAGLVEWTHQDYKHHNYLNGWERGIQLYHKPERPCAIVSAVPYIHDSLDQRHAHGGVYVSVIATIDGLPIKTGGFVNDIEITHSGSMERIL